MRVTRIGFVNDLHEKFTLSGDYVRRGVIKSALSRARKKEDGKRSKCSLDDRHGR